MTLDIILDTTVRFIRAKWRKPTTGFSYRRSTTLKSETELIKEFFKCVKQHVEIQLKEKVEADGTDGRLGSIGTEVLWIRKTRLGTTESHRQIANVWWGIQFLLSRMSRLEACEY